VPNWVLTAGLGLNVERKSEGAVSPIFSKGEAALLLNATTRKADPSATNAQRLRITDTGNQASARKASARRAVEKR
jgi:hypothetical protein